MRPFEPTSSRARSAALFAALEELVAADEALNVAGQALVEDAVRLGHSDPLPEHERAALHAQIRAVLAGKPLPDAETVCVPGRFRHTPSDGSGD